MKKLVLLAIAIVAMASCDKVGIAYNVQADGSADGKIEITFPDGCFWTDGDAKIAFDWCNDSTLVNGNTIPLEFALQQSDKQTLKAAQAVDEWLNDTFSVTALSGNYYVHFKGCVMETATGITISVDRTFHN